MLRRPRNKTVLAEESTINYQKAFSYLDKPFEDALRHLPEQERCLYTIETQHARRQLLMAFNTPALVREIVRNPLLSVTLTKAPQYIQDAITATQERARTIDLQKAVSSLPRHMQPSKTPSSDNGIHDLLVLMVKAHCFEEIRTNPTMAEAVRNSKSRQDSIEFGVLALQEKTKWIAAQGTKQQKIKAQPSP